MTKTMKDIEERIKQIDKEIDNLAMEKFDLQWEHYAIVQREVLKVNFTG